MTRNPRYVLVAFMAPTAPPLPTGLSDRLALIIAGLRGVLAAHMAKDRSAVEVLFLAWTRLGRLASRFEALVTAVRGGRLPAAPTPRAQAAADLELPRLEGLPQARKNRHQCMRLAPAKSAARVRRIATNRPKKTTCPPCLRNSRWLMWSRSGVINTSARIA